MRRTPRALLLVSLSFALLACTKTQPTADTTDEGSPVQEKQPPQTRPPSVSPAGTTIPPATRIVDTQLQLWTVTGGVVYLNGAPAGYSADVAKLYFDGNSVYQQNGAGGWWRWTGSSWAETTDPTAPATPPSMPPSSSPVSVDCTDGLKLYAGAYALENNQWGSAGVTGPFSQCAGMGPIAADGSVSARWTWTWPSGPNEVKGYPAIIYGQKPGTTTTPSSGLPRRLDVLSTAKTSWATHSTYTGTGQLTFDLWLTSDDQPHAGFVDTPLTHEIMLAVEPYGGYGLNRNPAWFIEQTVIDGVTYKVYKADNFGLPNRQWRFLVFQMLTPVVIGAVDWKPLFAYLKDKGFISGTEYLSSIELGTEIEQGTGDVQIDAFKATIN